MKQKILIIVNEFQNISQFRLPLINYLISKDFYVEILSYSADTENINSLKREINIKTHQIDGDSKGTQIFKEIYNLIKLFYFIKNIKPFLIMSFTIKPNIYSSLVSKILGINNILTITGLGSSYIENGLINKLNFFMYKIFSHKKIHYVFQNSNDKDVFLRKEIINENNFSVINGSGVDLSKFKKNINPKLILNKKSQFNFLFIGRLINHKGISELYNAALKLISITKKNIKFTLAGIYNPNDKYSIDPKLYDKIKKNENFDIVGFTNNIEKYIVNTDCVLLTSQREGMPMSLLQSGAIGRPIIASNVPGCNEIVVNNFNGFLYESGNFEDLYSKMHMIINLDKQKLLEFSYNCHDFVSNNFSSKDVNENYFSIIKKIL